MAKHTHVADSGGVLRAALSAASSGDQEIVAAVAGKVIRVLSVAFIAVTEVTVGFESHSAGGDAALTGVMSFPATGGMVLNHNPYGWFQTRVGEALHITLGGAVQVSGCFTYQVLDT
jgi:hypothetical protein